MSASEDNTPKQRRRHRGPLIGLILVLGFALGLLVWWLGYEVSRGEAPEGAPAKVDGRTGEVEPRPADPTAPRTTP